MRNFLLGFGAGIITYHYISGGFKNEELVTEMRGMIKKLDDRLAQKDSEEPPTAPVDESPFPSPTSSPYPNSEDTA